MSDEVRSCVYIVYSVCCVYVRYDYVSFLIVSLSFEEHFIKSLLANPKVYNLSYIRFLYIDIFVQRYMRNIYM